MRAISRSKSLDSILPLHYMTQPWIVCCNGWQEDKGSPLVMASWRSGCSAKIIQEGIALSQANLPLAKSFPIAISLREKQRVINELFIQAALLILPGDLQTCPHLKGSSPDFSLRYNQSWQVPNVSAHLSMVTHIKSRRGIWFLKFFRNPPIKCHLLSQQNDG